MRRVAELAEQWARAKSFAHTDASPAFGTFEWEGAPIPEMYECSMRAFGWDPVLLSELLIRLAEAIPLEDAPLVQALRDEIKRNIVANCECAYQIGIAVGRRLPPLA